MLSSLFWLGVCSVDFSQFVRRDIINFLHGGTKAGFGLDEPPYLEGLLVIDCSVYFLCEVIEIFFEQFDGQFVVSDSGNKAFDQVAVGSDVLNIGVCLEG